MREIKFRAWGESEESNWKKVMQHSFDVEPDGEIFYGGNAQPDWILMQYTGLLDKDGKEIYEGDIVKGSYSNNGIIRYGDGLVDASDYEAYAIPIHGFYIDNGNIDSQRVSDWPTGTPYSLAECHEDIEVIGNIWENPDLLKERNSV